jgi:hypothetical protein
MALQAKRAAAADGKDIKKDSIKQSADENQPKS